jgi:uncharacterized protein (TIGR02246 family)
MTLFNRVLAKRSIFLSLTAFLFTAAIAQPGQANPAASPAQPAVTQPTVTQPTVTQPADPSAIAPSGETALTGEAATVDATTRQWIATVTSGKSTVVEDVLALYADDAILLATVSEQIRDTKAELRDYFEFFTALPHLSAKDYIPTIRVYDDIAINTGYYTFMYESEPGKIKEVHARYTFTYHKVDGKWLIVEHHSSVVPTAPAGLTPAN